MPTEAEEENELKSQSEIAGEEGSETSKSESENGEEALAEGSEVTYDFIIHYFLFITPCTWLPLHTPHRLISNK